LRSLLLVSKISLACRAGLGAAIPRKQGLLALLATSEGNEGQEKLEGNLRIADALRQLRESGAEEEAAELREAEQEAKWYAGDDADDLLAEVPEGAKAAQELLTAGDQTVQSRLYKFFVAGVLANEQPKVLIHGPGGCGKSHFIKAVTHTLRTAECPVAIAAPTGCAAFLIRGATLHSCLSLPVTNESYGRAGDAPLPTGALLQNLTATWRRVRLLVIDEISMISEETIRLVDQRLQLFRGKPGCET